MSEKKEEENGMEEIINKKEDENELDEITIIYNFNKIRKKEIDKTMEMKDDLGETISKEKLFGERFIKKKMIINNKEEEICSYLSNYKKYMNKGKLEIKLKGIKNIIDSSYMFSGCLSLYSLPNISKWNVSNIINMRGMFFYCSSF